MSYTANTPTVHSLCFLSTHIASAFSKVLWHPTAFVQDVISLNTNCCCWCRCCYHLQANFAARPEIFPMMAPRNIMCSRTITCLCSRELDHQGKFYSLYLFNNILVPAVIFLYCHLIRTAQSPIGTSGHGGRESSCKPLLVAETELPSHFCSQPVIWKISVQTKTWQRNAVFTENHIFLCFCESAVAWKTKCYCWVKTACLSHSLTKRSAWTWIFLEPQPCMNSKLSRERKGINEVFVVRQSPLK